MCIFFVVIDGISKTWWACHRAAASFQQRAHSRYQGSNTSARLRRRCSRGCRCSPDGAFLASFRTSFRASKQHCLTSTFDSRGMTSQFKKVWFLSQVSETWIFKALISMLIGFSRQSSTGMAHFWNFLESQILILQFFFSLDTIYLKCSFGFRSINVLSQAGLELSGFNGKSSKVGTLGDSLFRFYPLPSPFTRLLCDLKLMPKPQWLPCWMLTNFEVGEVWQMAWGFFFFFFNGSYGEATSPGVTQTRRGLYGFRTRRTLAKHPRGQKTGVVNNVLFLWFTLRNKQDFQSSQSLINGEGIY